MDQWLQVGVLGGWVPEMGLHRLLVFFPLLAPDGALRKALIGSNFRFLGLPAGLALCVSIEAGGNLENCQMQTPKKTEKRKKSGVYMCVHVCMYACVCIHARHGDRHCNGHQWISVPKLLQDLSEF